jgi:hypothetical protein
MRKSIFLCLVLCFPLLLLGQVEIDTEAQLSLSNGRNPLWLNANKYGLSSLDHTNGYVRAGAFRPLSLDSMRRWGWSAGADIAVTGGYTSTVVVHQAYAELRWLKGLLTVGAKEQPLELKDQRLSTGSQTLGINARPVPAVRLSMPDYWDIPGLDKWLGVKGHISYGLTTDSRWQKDFTDRRSDYTENVRLHTKAGYLRIGQPHRPLTVELGMEMACQYGGKSHLFILGQESVVENEQGLKGMWHALVPGGEEVLEKDMVYKNTSGNHVGSYVARVNYDQPTWGVSLYADHFFDDQSQMFFYSNISYGDDGNWKEKSGRRYLVFDLKDMMLGLELRVKNSPWLEKFVVEYLYTKYQSGPIYHDHSEHLTDHIAGQDNYYNHSVFAAYQHWGQVMGNPLYMSPLYNADGRITVADNRFAAWHFAATSQPMPGLRYRLMCTWQRGLGTYLRPYSNPRRNVSLMAEAEYSFPKDSRFAGFSIIGAVASDRGSLLGDNTGMQLTVAKKFNINPDKR